MIEYERPAWHRWANCRGIDPALMFPDRGANVDIPKAVCANCPVRDQCLTHALTKPELFGIWGGMSERQRRGMRRRLGLVNTTSECVLCGEPFEQTAPNRKYCSAECSYTMERKRQRAYHAERKRARREAS